MQIVVNQLLTHYVRNGSGPVVLLLHGWGDSVEGWRSFSLALSIKYDVIALDLPGFGQTQMPENPWGLDQYVHFIASFVQKLDIVPYAIIGHSNGGAIAIRGIATEELETQKLILLASAGIRTKTAKKQALQLLTKLAKQFSKVLPKGQQRKLRAQLYGAVGSEMLLVPGMEASFRKIVGQDVTKDAAKISIPTLLVYGSLDSATPPSYGAQFHQLISGSKLVAVSGASHFVHHDAEKLVLEEVGTFL